MFTQPKSYCRLHPNELVTNFCTKSQCMVALCANCICTHTQQHVKEKSTPQYENIRVTQKNLQNEFSNKLTNFQNLKQRIDNVKAKSYEKRDQLKQLVMEARKSCHQTIDEFFDLHCQNILKEIQATQRKAGVHSYNRLESLENMIRKEIKNLISESQQITQSGFIEAIPKLRNVTLRNVSKTIEEINRQISHNETFQIMFQYREEAIKQLSETMKTMIQFKVQKLVARPQKNTNASASMFFDKKKGQQQVEYGLQRGISVETKKKGQFPDKQNTSFILPFLMMMNK